MNQVIAIILGGGRGSRLFPLTLARSKPAVPIGGKYRLIDIPISNCINSDLRRMFVLTQYNSESLNKHVNFTYKFDLFSPAFVNILAAEQRRTAPSGSRARRTRCGRACATSRATVRRKCWSSPAISSTRWTTASSWTAIAARWRTSRWR